MSELKCRICGEPIDVSEFRDIAEIDGRSFLDVFTDFTNRGCKAIESAYGPQHCTPFPTSV